MTDQAKQEKQEKRLNDLILNVVDAHQHEIDDDCVGMIEDLIEWAEMEA